MNVSEAKIAPGMTEGKFSVVETEELQQRCVQVVDMDRILDRLEAELVGRPVNVAATHPPASQPHRRGTLTQWLSHPFDILSDWRIKETNCANTPRL